MLKQKRLILPSENSSHSRNPSQQSRKSQEFAEKKIKLITLAQKMKNHPDFQLKYSENNDIQNREIALNKIFEEVMARNRKNELELYRLTAKDDAFKTSILETLKMMIGA